MSPMKTRTLIIAEAGVNHNGSEDLALQLRQDFIAYYTDTGRLEIETPVEKERELMRDTFALSFFGDASFFSGANAAVAIDLSVLKASDFALPTLLLDRGYKISK